MKRIKLLLFLLISISTQAQVAVTTGIGVHDDVAHVILSAGGDIGKWTINVGYNITTTNVVTKSDFLYIKGGRIFTIGRDENIHIIPEIGPLIETYANEVYTGTDPLYSHYRKEHFLKMYYSLSVYKHVKWGWHTGISLTSLGGKVVPAIVIKLKLSS